MSLSTIDFTRLSATLNRLPVALEVAEAFCYAVLIQFYRQNLTLKEAETCTAINLRAVFPQLSPEVLRNGHLLAWQWAQDSGCCVRYGDVWALTDAGKAFVERRAREAGVDLEKELPKPEPLAMYEGVRTGTLMIVGLLATGEMIADEVVDECNRVFAKHGSDIRYNLEKVRWHLSDGLKSGICELKRVGGKRSMQAPVWAMTTKGRDMLTR